MKNLFNILNINKLSKNSEGGVNLLSEFSHTLSPRQAGMACLGFFFVPGGQTPQIFEPLNLKSLNNTKSLNLN